MSSYASPGVARRARCRDNGNTRAARLGKPPLLADRLRQAAPSGRHRFARWRPACASGSPRIARRSGRPDDPISAWHPRRRHASSRSRHAHVRPGSAPAVAASTPRRVRSPVSFCQLTLFRGMGKRCQREHIQQRRRSGEPGQIRRSARPGSRAASPPRKTRRSGPRPRAGSPPAPARATPPRPSGKGRPSATETGATSSSSSDTDLHCDGQTRGWPATAAAARLSTQRAPEDDNPGGDPHATPLGPANEPAGPHRAEAGENQHRRSAPARRPSCGR